MKEELKSPSEFEITHEQALAHPELRAKYRDERVAAIKAGESVWLMHGIDLHHHQDRQSVYYYQDGKPVGFVEGDNTHGYHVYGPPLEEEDRYHHINTSPIETLSGAMISLEDYLQAPE